MDPKDIPDENVRKAYERALSENAENIKFVNVQTSVRKILDDLATRYSAALNSNDLNDTDRANVIEKINKSAMATPLKAKFISK